MKIFKKSTAVLLIILMLTLTCTIMVSARDIATFDDFTVTYNGAEKFTRYCTKAVSDRDAVVNLSNDTGSAWITANVKNSEGSYRGGVNVQRGKRVQFACNGKAGYNYKLGLRKTNDTGGGSVTIKGSWSPDFK